jgi:hypothetical protein
MGLLQGIMEFSDMSETGFAETVEIGLLMEDFF